VIPAIVVALLLPGFARAATITVDTTADTSPTGHCALRDAITAAVTNAVPAGTNCTAGSDPDTINFNVTGIVHLATALPTVTSGVDIRGPGADKLVVRRNAGAAPFGIFSLTGGTSTISGLTVSGGLYTSDGGGAGIYAAGAGLTLDGVRVTNNAILDENNFQLGLNSNAAGITAPGPLTITNSEIDHNVTSVTGHIDSGFALASGAGITAVAATTIDRSLVADNTVSTADTGAGSVATALGGGIDVEDLGALTLTRSTVSDNGSVSSTGASGGGAAGIYTNTAGAVSLELDTISGNQAVSSAGSATGGGILAAGAASFLITSSTIAGNEASLSHAANLASNTSSPSVRNTIVSNPVGTSLNCSSAVTSSGGHNLEDLDTCGFSGTGDLPSTDPDLVFPVTSNGGPTPTLALAPGSPAIDSGLAPAGETADQRGSARPADLAAVPNALGSDAADIGAFEVQPPPTTTPPPPTTTLPPAPAPGSGSPAQLKRKCRKSKKKRHAVHKKCKRAKPRSA
jgi:hypothetical protein